MDNQQFAIIDPMRAAAMHAMLGHGGPEPAVGAALPEFWHWSQFWNIAAAADLGRDGHPATGQFLPDTGLPRRMWAGGEITFSAPIPIGSEAARTSEVAAPVRKIGRSGPLAFVSVTHTVHADGAVAIVERQDLVFREDPKPGDAAPKPQAAPDGATHRREYRQTQADLFRYSALTFNGHRIHYDIDYCRDVEGYPGLVVHGPLLAQRLVDLAREILGGVRAFSFRAVMPVFQPQAYVACAAQDGDALTLWIETEDGHLAMTGQAS